jgi:hypothetical protein
MVDFASTQAHTKEVTPPSIREGGEMGGHYGEAPECFTSTHHRWGGQDVLPTGGDPCHLHHVSGLEGLAY